MRGDTVGPDDRAVTAESLQIPYTREGITESVAIELLPEGRLAAKRRSDRVRLGPCHRLRPASAGHHPRRHSSAVNGRLEIDSFVAIGVVDVDPLKQHLSRVRVCGDWVGAVFGCVIDDLDQGVAVDLEVSWNSHSEGVVCSRRGDSA